MTTDVDVTSTARRNGDTDDPAGRVPGSIGDVVRRAMCADVARLIAHDAAARLAFDTRGVHQARVATRRLRSNLGTFEPVLRSEPAARLVKDLRWLGRALGVVRDLDVLRERISDDVRVLDPLARGDGIVLIEAIDVERRRAGDALCDVLATKRYRQLLASLAATAADPPFRRSAGLPAEDFLGAAIQRRYEALVAATEALPAVAQDVELHAVRILAKPVRYAAELGADVLGAPCGRFARRITDVCDALGDLNDGAKANQWLDEVAVAPWRAFAVGRVRAGEIGKMVEARTEWRRGWERSRAAAAEMESSITSPG